MIARSRRVFTTAALTGVVLLVGCTGGSSTDPVLTTRTVSVSTTGTGGGTVTSSPAGIACGMTCSSSLGVSTAVTLTATPNTNSTFAGWSGACTGTSTTCIIAAGSSAASASATFNLVTFSLTAALAGTGTGTVTSAPAGITCGTACTTTFTSGAQVTLTAAPAASSTFAGWSGGGCTGTAACVVTMTQAATVTATFTITSQTLIAALAGNGTGVVTSTPAGINCGASCSAPYTFGTSVTLTAAANVSSNFTGWSGGGCTGTGTCVVAVTQATTVTATFTLKSSLLTVVRAGVGTGTVTSTPAGITCGTSCTATYNYGTAITLTTATDATSVFTGWSGACTGTGACVVTMNSAATVTATFGLFQQRWPDSATRTCTNLTAFVACPGGPVGQDGFYTINVPVYETVGGTVHDPVTGLVWERTPPTTNVTQAAAFTYCGSLSLAGTTDWRLPTYLELLSIADFGAVGPAYPSSAFPGIPTNSAYWTSTDVPGDPSQAIGIFTNYSVSRGFAKTTSAGYIVRCVRGTTFTGTFSSVASTVVDGRTALVWQSGVSPTDLSWTDALSYCEALVLDGQTDWRLPSGKELLSVIDVTRTNPSISPLFAMRPATPFWSSSVVANTPGSGYAMNFATGLSDGITTPFANLRSVRCVR